MQYRVGIIGRTGRGNYGHGLDIAWEQIPETQVVAVADDDRDGLAAAARRLRLNSSAAYPDYREMIDRVKPDIVAICPRWVDLHHAMAIAAIERGCHVYLEKPLCRTLDEADQIAALAAKRHAKLAVAHPTHYSPKLATVIRLIDDGAIGRVLEYRARGKEDRRGGGEDLWVLGTHVLDMIRAIGGHPLSCVATVRQDGHRVTAKDVVEGPEGIGPLTGDHVEAMYQMTDGSAAYFSSVRNAGGNPRRYGLQIFGSKGVLEIVEGTLPPVKYLGDATWSPGRSGAQWQDVSSAGIGLAEPLSGAEYSARHTLAIRDFLQAIEDDRQPLDGIEAARGVTEMISAVFESHRTGGPVSLPLQNRKNPLTLL